MDSSIFDDQTLFTEIQENDLRLDSENIDKMILRYLPEWFTRNDDGSEGLPSPDINENVEDVNIECSFIELQHILEEVLTDKSEGRHDSSKVSSVSDLIVTDHTEHMSEKTNVQSGFSEFNDLEINVNDMELSSQIEPHLTPAKSESMNAEDNRVEIASIESFFLEFQKNDLENATEDTPGMNLPLQSNHMSALLNMETHPEDIEFAIKRNPSVRFQEADSEVDNIEHSHQQNLFSEFQENYHLENATPQPSFSSTISDTPAPVYCEDITEFASERSSSSGFQENDSEPDSNEYSRQQSLFSEMEIDQNVPAMVLQQSHGSLSQPLLLNVQPLLDIQANSFQQSSSLLLLLRQPTEAKLIPVKLKKYETVKDAIRRTKNNEASKVTRAKKRTKIEKLLEKEHDLKNENLELKRKREKVEEEIKMFEDFIGQSRDHNLISHIKSAYKFDYVKMP